MATSPVITGAPTRASSNVVPFPLTPVARMRLRLASCRSDRMREQWLADLRKMRSALPEVEYGELIGRLAVMRHFPARAEGC